MFFGVFANLLINKNKSTFSLSSCSQNKTNISDCTSDILLPMPATQDKSTALSLDSPVELTKLLSGVALTSEESMVSQIHRVLLDLIVSLKLQPGQLVSEKEVAESLSASKTPVREALIRLENSGLVKIVPKSGSYVTPISISAYIEGCFIRVQLETGAVRRAATRCDANAQDKLNSIIEQQASALDAEKYEDFFALDQALHFAFFEIAGVPGVWQMLNRTQSDVNRVRHLKRINKIRRGPAVLKQHIKIVEALSSGDSDASERALIEHIGSLEREIDLLMSNPDLLAFIEQQQDASHVRKRSLRKASAN